MLLFDGDVRSIESYRIEGASNNTMTRITFFSQTDQLIQLAGNDDMLHLKNILSY